MALSPVLTDILYDLSLKLPELVFTSNSIDLEEELDKVFSSVLDSALNPSVENSYYVVIDRNNVSTTEIFQVSHNALTPALATPLFTVHENGEVTLEAGPLMGAPDSLSLRSQTVSGPTAVAIDIDTTNNIVANGSVLLKIKSQGNDRFVMLHGMSSLGVANKALLRVLDELGAVKVELNIDDSVLQFLSGASIVGGANAARLDLQSSGRAVLSSPATGSEVAVEAIGAITSLSGIVDSPAAVAHLLDTVNNLVSPGALLLAVREAGTDAFTIDYNHDAYLDGDLSLAGTVDGRDVSTDGATLDAHLDGGINKHDASEIDVEGTYVNIPGTPTDLETVVAAIDAFFGAENIWDHTGTAISPHFPGDDLTLGAGNITLSGTVDGRDVSVDGATLDALDSQTSQQTRVLYVDKFRTDLYTPDGTIRRPFTTIMDAVNEVIAEAVPLQDWTIYIMSGQYQENVILENPALNMLALEGIGVVGIVPTSGNSVQSITNNANLIKFRMRNIECTRPFVITGSAGSTMFSDVWIENCKFVGANGTIVATCINNLSLTGCYLENDVTLSNVAWFHAASQQMQGAFSMTCDSVQPAPSNGSSGVALITGCYGMGAVTLIKGGTATASFVLVGSRMNSSSGTVTIPVGWTVQLYGSFLRGNVVNNGTLQLRSGFVEGNLTGTGTTTRNQKASQIQVTGTYANIPGTPGDAETAFSAIDAALGNENLLDRTLGVLVPHITANDPIDVGIGYFKGGHHKAAAHNTYDLGEDLVRYRDIYYAGTLHGGNSPMNFKSKEADGAGARAFIFDTANSLSTAGARVLSIRNATVEKAYLDKDGMISFAGVDTSVLPSINSAYSLGSATKAWGSLLLDSGFATEYGQIVFAATKGIGNPRWRALDDGGDKALQLEGWAKLNLMNSAALVGVKSISLAQVVGGTTISGVQELGGSTLPGVESIIGSATNPFYVLQLDSLTVPNDWGRVIFGTTKSVGFPQIGASPDGLLRSIYFANTEYVNFGRAIEKDVGFIDFFDNFAYGDIRNVRSVLPPAPSAGRSSHLGSTTKPFSTLNLQWESVNYPNEGGWIYFFANNGGLIPRLRATTAANPGLEIVNWPGGIQFGNDLIPYGVATPNIGQQTKPFRSLWLDNGVVDGGTIHFDDSLSRIIQCSSDGLVLRFGAYNTFSTLDIFNATIQAYGGGDYGMKFMVNGSSLVPNYEYDSVYPYVLGKVASWKKAGVEIFEMNAMGGIASKSAAGTGLPDFNSYLGTPLNPFRSLALGGDGSTIGGFIGMKGAGNERIYAGSSDAGATWWLACSYFDKFYFQNTTGSTIVRFDNTGVINSNGLFPLADNLYDIGSTSFNWRSLYLNNGVFGGGTIYFDGGTSSYLASNAAGTILTQQFDLVTCKQELQVGAGKGFISGYDDANVAIRFEGTTGVHLLWLSSTAWGGGEGALSPNTTNLNPDLGQFGYPFRHIYLNNGATDAGAIYFDGGTSRKIEGNAAGTELLIGGFATTKVENFLKFSNGASIGSDDGNVSIRFMADDGTHLLWLSSSTWAGGLTTGKGILAPNATNLNPFLGQLAAGGYTFGHISLDLGGTHGGRVYFKGASVATKYLGADAAGTTLSINGFTDFDLGGAALIGGASPFSIKSKETNGASAVGFALDTNNSLAAAGAKLFSLRNATVEKFAIDKDGNVQVQGTKVVGSQQSAVADAAVVTTAGANTGTAGAGLSLIGDTSAADQSGPIMNDLRALQEDVTDLRAQLNAALAVLRAHGLIAT